MLKQDDLEEVLKSDIFRGIIDRNLWNGFRDIHFSPIKSKNACTNIIFDSQLGILLIAGGKRIAFSGISYGLDDYYSIDSVHPKFKEKKEYTSIISLVGNEPVITEMQAVSGTLKLRDNIDWRLALTQVWEEILRLDGHKKIDYLPARLNYWQVPSVQEQLFEREFFRAPWGVFKTNYDNNALRCKYSPNPEKFGIFEKEI